MNLALAITLLAATPFVGSEQRIGPVRNPLDLTLVRSAGSTLLAWQEETHVKARVEEKTIDFGIGSDVRAATDGSDFQIIWVDQNRVAGARWSKPSDVKTLVNLGSFVVDYFGSQYRRPPAMAWNGTAFQIFTGYDQADTAAALNGVVISAAGTSEGTHKVCPPFGFGFPICYDVPPSQRIDWKVRRGDAPVRSFSLQQDGYISTHYPFITAGANEFLLVWKASTSIDGVLLRPDGSNAGFITVPIANSLSGKRGPQVAFDGTRYLIVFDTDGDVWGAFVTPGVTYVAQPFAISATAAQEGAPTVAAIGPDRFAVAYAIDSNQIGTRIVSFSEPPSRNRAVR